MRLAKPGIASGLLFLAVAIEFGAITTVAAQENRSTDAAAKGVSLAGTEWRLIELDGKAVPRGGLESYFALKESRQLAGGSIGQLVSASAAGCNRLMGSYETNGHSLRFEELSTTAMLCVPNKVLIQAPIQPPFQAPSGFGQHTYRDERVPLFLNALRETSSFEIHGSTLSLLGRDGVVLARLDATTPD
jgi:heat shock protein HslJ